MGDAFERSLLLVFFILITVFTLAWRASAGGHHIIIHLLRISGLKILFLQLVVLNKLIRATVVRVSLVEYVLAHLVKRFRNIQVQVEKLVHYLFVYDCVLIINLLLRNEVQVVRQVLHVPYVLLDFLQRDALHGVRLQHPVDEVLHSWRQITWYIISTFFYFIK